VGGQREREGLAVVLARVMVEPVNAGRVRPQPDAGQLTGQDLIVRQAARWLRIAWPGDG
jgi:hypothetical protein